MNAPEPDIKNHEGHTFVAGIDWGKHKDYTVISIGCRECREEVYLDRFNKIDYIYQRDRIGKALTKWNVTNGLAELNSIGEPNLEMLQASGYPLQGFSTTNQSKAMIIENQKLVFESEEMQYLNIPIATAEFEAYEMKVNALGRPIYNAPAGVHDDTVIARALMTHSITSYMPAFL
jgi:hypothetical protein